MRGITAHHCRTFYRQRPFIVNSAANASIITGELFTISNRQSGKRRSYAAIDVKHAALVIPANRHAAAAINRDIAFDSQFRSG